MAVVGSGMTWGEAKRLTQRLLADPGTEVGAAVAGWAHPASREDIVLRDLFDLQHQSKAERKPKPYPRPWAANGHRRVKPSVSQAEVIAALRMAGHTAPIPFRT